MPGRTIRWGLIALAVAARAAAVLALQSHAVPNSTYEHGAIAANLLAGRGFATRFLGADGPTSQQAPIYPCLVAAAYAAGGVGTPRALLLLELGQAALGGLLVAAVMALAREAAPGRPRLAALAGLVAAVHPTLVYAATHVQVALLAATLLAATLALAYRCGRTGRDRDALAAGLALALLALTDPILGLAAPGIAWAVAQGRWRRSDSAGTSGSSPADVLEGPSLAGKPPVAPEILRPEPGATGGLPARVRDGPACAIIRPVALIALAAGLGVAPWVARNARVHGEFVFIKSTFGYAFWQGNCALSEGTDKVVRPSVERALGRNRGGLRGLNDSLWAARHEAGYLDDIALTRADYRTLAGLSEPARSRLLFRRALADLRADPGRYPRLCLRRLRYFVLFDETNPKTRNFAYRASHLALTALAALGWAFMPPDLRRRLGPTALTAALVAAFHALTIASARFHVPIEPLMGLWAAAGMADRHALRRTPPTRETGRASHGPTPIRPALLRRPLAARPTSTR